MNEIKIPTSFQLFGSDWSILWDNKRMQDRESYGTSSYATKEITLSNIQESDTLAEDKINQTYFHELTHAILDSMHEYDLSNNEKFVNIFSELLYQSIKTAKYE